MINTKNYKDRLVIVKKMQTALDEYLNNYMLENDNEAKIYLFYVVGEIFKILDEEGWSSELEDILSDRSEDNKHEQTLFDYYMV